MYAATTPIGREVCEYLFPLVEECVGAPEDGHHHAVVRVCDVERALELLALAGRREDLRELLLGLVDLRLEGGALLLEGLAPARVVRLPQRELRVPALDLLARAAERVQRYCPVVDDAQRRRERLHVGPREVLLLDERLRRRGDLRRDRRRLDARERLDEARVAREHATVRLVLHRLADKERDELEERRVLRARRVRREPHHRQVAVRQLRHLRAPLRNPALHPRQLVLQPRKLLPQRAHADLLHAVLVVERRKPPVEIVALLLQLVRRLVRPLTHLREVRLHPRKALLRLHAPRLQVADELHGRPRLLVLAPQVRQVAQRELLEVVDHVVVRVQ
jgi:hypothetical protein